MDSDEEIPCPPTPPSSPPIDFQERNHLSLKKFIQGVRPLASTSKTTNPNPPSNPPIQKRNDESQHHLALQNIQNQHKILEKTSNTFINLFEKSEKFIESKNKIKNFIDKGKKFDAEVARNLQLEKNNNSLNLTIKILKNQINEGQKQTENLTKVIEQQNEKIKKFENFERNLQEKIASQEKTISEQNKRISALQANAHSAVASLKKIKSNSLQDSEIYKKTLQKYKSDEVSNKSKFQKLQEQVANMERDRKNESTELLKVKLQNEANSLRNKSLQGENQKFKIKSMKLEQELSKCKTNLKVQSESLKTQKDQLLEKTTAGWVMDRMIRI